MYSLLYEKRVVSDDLPHLGAFEKKQVAASIEKKLTTHPELFGKPLRQSLRGYRSLRTGDFRVVFRIEKKEVKIFKIGHRSTVYQKAMERLS